MSDLNELLRKRIVLDEKGNRDVRVMRNIEYCSALAFDLYLPGVRSPEERSPVVFLVHGEAPIQSLKGAGQFISIGETLASKGIAAVSFDRRKRIDGVPIHEILSDIAACRDFVGEHAEEYGIDSGRTAVWGFSAGVPFALYSGLHHDPEGVRCLVCYYGFGDFASLDSLIGKESGEAYPAMFSGGEKPVPVFAARAGRDSPLLNMSLDAFIGEAETRGFPVSAAEHPKGRHAFDIVDDNERSREILRETLSFLEAHLAEKEA